MPVPATPLCRCRVLYIGSAVPLKSKDGLQGIQDPLKQLYPVDAAPDTRGVDGWLSAWINGLVLEYTDADKELFFPIQTLHYCAAVRYVNVGPYALEGGGEKFLPLDSPFANLPQTHHPPIFAAILRRTQGVKVLECHAFICMNEKAANALVRCCFNAYADSMYLDMTAEALGAGNGAVDVADSAAGASKILKSRMAHDSRSNSPTGDAPVEAGNGYGQNDVERHEREREAAARAMTAATAKYAWQNRQQAGDYETASIGSSQAGKYRKKQTGGVAQSATIASAKEASKATMMKRPPSAAATHSNALVPYGGPSYQPFIGTLGTRRTKSEIDIHTAARGVTGPQAMVPYMPPHLMMRPPFPPMFLPPRPPHGMMPRFPGPYPPMGGPMMPPQPPFMPPFMGMVPPEGFMDPAGWRPPHMGHPFGQQPGMPPFYGPPMPPPGSQKKRKSSKKQNGFYEPMPPLFGTIPPYGMVPPRPPFRSFEEPPYMPGRLPMQMMGPGVRMPFPGGFPPPPRGPPGFETPFPLGYGGMPPYYPMAPGSDGYPFEDDYHDSYRPKQGAQKYQQQRDVDRGSLEEDSPVSSGRSATIKRSPIPDYWENRNVYDGSTLFRKQNLNEKAFGTSIKQETTQQPPSKGGRYVGDSASRPPEPAPDYGRVNGNPEQPRVEQQFRDLNLNGAQNFEGRTVYKESYGHT